MSDTASRPLPTEGPSAGGGDEFDDLFNYEVDGGINDPFSENYEVPEAKERAKEAASKAKSGAGLGIDEEIEVTRKPRAPRVKLDEDRWGILKICIGVVLIADEDYFLRTESLNCGIRRSIILSLRAKAMRQILPITP